MELPKPISKEGKIQLIAKFDVLYKTLLKIGFMADDIHMSIRATMSLQIEDHFDYVCKN